VSQVFSLLPGGTASRLLLRFGITLGKQAALAPIVTWVPLALLTMIEGTATGHAVRMPFVRDALVHTRLLLALPIYLAAARFIDMGVGIVAGEFLHRDVVRDRDRYAALIESIERLRDSRVAGAAILLFAIGRALQSIELVRVTSWITREPAYSLTAAGWWYAVVSLPILFLVTGRWIWRFLLWIWFLARVSRLDLHLVSSHPDSAGGIGFISLWHLRFAVLMFLSCSMFSAAIANLIRVYGHKLPEYTEVIIVIASLHVVLMIAPMLFLTPRLMAAYFEGKRVYGRLGMEYVRNFEQKWVGLRDGAEQFLGTADIQSLADLSNSYQVVVNMRLLLINRQEFIKLVLLAAGPFAPLLLTMMSPGQILKLVMSVVK
jgi:hypothetical protein